MSGFEEPVTISSVPDVYWQYYTDVYNMFLKYGCI